MGFRYEIRLTGSGGQGIILMGIILAEAVGIYEGKFVATNEKNFFFYDSDQRILVGNRKDLVCVPEAGEHISFTAS